MGWKTKKYKAEKFPKTADIGEMLRGPQGTVKPVMAPLSDRLSYSSSETSLPDMEELDSMARRLRAEIPAKKSESSPVTEGALMALLDNVRHNIGADINSFKEEISAVLRRLRDAELTTAAYEVPPH
ncbi:Hypothetical predicted protein [Pelobates cultripes]|uniref:Uncharacterized protein n=1 Tax=Pelobates cultripes TaxID=61616 RepID=A0AAD1W5A6_PELCU|nr:Hypothetical predicted protein [Pelobates cultripes]